MRAAWATEQVVKVIWHRAAHWSFNRIRQMASMCTSIQYVVPWAHTSLLSPYGVSVCSAVLHGPSVCATHADHGACDVCSSRPHRHWLHRSMAELPVLADQVLDPTKKAPDPRRLGEGSETWQSWQPLHNLKSHSLCCRRHCWQYLIKNWNEKNEAYPPPCSPPARGVAIRWSDGISEIRS